MPPISAAFIRASEVVGLALHPSFNESYRGSPPWDIGRPQSEFIRLAENGEIHGKVLDVGCGTGENAIYFSRFGKEVWGIDSAPLAIEKAKQKARERGVNVRFSVADAFRLGELKTRFDAVTDCGLFHTFSDEERSLFAKSLISAMAEHGTYFMLCFSTKEPTDWVGHGECPRKKYEESSAMAGKSTTLGIQESRPSSMKKEAEGCFRL